MIKKKARNRLAFFIYYANEFLYDMRGGETISGDDLFPGRARTEAVDVKQSPFRSDEPVPVGALAHFHRHSDLDFARQHFFDTRRFVCERSRLGMLTTRTS